MTVNVHDVGVPSRGLVVRVPPGEDILESLGQAIAEHGIRTGAVVSAIGTLRDCHLHMVETTGFPVREAHPEWHDVAFELASMNGLILDGEPHLHGVVSTAEGAVGGHIEPGCVVLYLCEILLLVFDAENVGRAPDANGVAQIVAK
ncbi:PPC domain-containing DNA-binding protein [Prauserella cavernicola]|uniref:DNA-binding protein n=1 Tax=Prauserella cavernicola TaxID=2800127 RepID=A0A934QN69_9PSEU|nr:PPC domain-containing DNA-binding protein [Prauserella cavernicola]MBK1783560.1 DNA-binding protein [Prauserella cavernicola]